VPVPVVRLNASARVKPEATGIMMPGPVIRGIVSLTTEPATQTQADSEALAVTP